VFRVIVRSLAAGVLLLAPACASLSSPPIRLEMTPADAELLTGEWYGNYLVDEPHGRRGTLVFKLQSGDDHAHGSVLMIPEGSTRAYERYHRDPPLRGRQTAPPSQVLTIRLVRAIDGAVSGELDPYWDPDRDCPATTRFRGVMGDGIITGTFTTRFGTGITTATGRWTVTRLPVRARVR
jgi:hypothetical protein